MALDMKGLKFNWRAAPPKPVQIVLVVLPLIAALAVTFFLIYSPNKKKIDKLNKEIEKQEQEIAKSKSMAAKLEELMAENSKLKEKLRELEEQLPEENEISSLLKQVSDLTHEAGLEIQSWTPSRNRNHPSGIVFEVPVSVSIVGGYHNLGRFFASLTQLERIVNVSDITLGSPTLDRDKIILNIKFTAVTFTAVPEARIQ